MKKVYQQGYYKPLNIEKCKNTKPMNFKSKLELKIMGYLDRNKCVTSWSYESIRIPYISPVDGCGHIYFTDFLIHVDTGTERYTAIIEAKASCFVPSPANLKIVKGRRATPSKAKMVNELIVNDAKFTSCINYCKKRGWKFFIMTEKSEFEWFVGMGLNLK